MKHRSRITTVVFLLLVAVAASCGFSEEIAADLAARDEIAAEQQTSSDQASRASAVLGAACYDFSSFAGSFGVGDVIPTSDAIITFHQFQSAGGGWIANGVATVVTSSWADGTPSRELNLNNIMVRVTPDTPATGAYYRYADLGGNVNFGVNGDFRNVNDLIALDGTVVGGCDISVTRVSFGPGGFNHRGEVWITPRDGVTIERFGAGGQEFYVDDVCHW